MSKGVTKRGSDRLRRPSFSDEEKVFIFESIDEAKSRGLEVKTVMEDLADTLGASVSMVKNAFYHKANRKVLDKKPDPVESQLSINEVEDDEIKEVEVKEEVNDAPVAEKPPERVRQIVDVNLYDLVNAQSKVLLDRIENLIAERDEYKRLYEAEKVEKSRLKEKLFEHFMK